MRTGSLGVRSRMRPRVISAESSENERAKRSCCNERRNNVAERGPHYVALLPRSTRRLCAKTRRRASCPSSFSFSRDFYDSPWHSNGPVSAAFDTHRRLFCRYVYTPVFKELPNSYLAHFVLFCFFFSFTHRGSDSIWTRVGFIEGGTRTCAIVHCFPFFRS